MQISVDLVSRHLESHSYQVSYHNCPSPHLMAIESCRAYERGKRLKPDTLYVANPDDLAKRITVPNNAALFVAGKPEPGVRISGTYVTVTGVSFTTLLNESFEAFHMYAQLERSLMQALDERNSVQELVEIVAPFFDNEIIVMNSNFRVVGHSYEPIELYIVSNIPAPEDFETVPMEVASFFQNDAIYRDVETSREPFYYDPSVFSVRVYCINIVVQNEYASRLVLCETRNAITPCDEELFKFFATFIQKHYDRTDNAVDLGEDSLASLVEDLLNGIPRTQERIERALARRGWHADDALVCACLKTSGYESRERTLPYYSREIARAFPETCTAVHSGYIGLIANLTSCNGDAEKFFNRFALMQREGNLRIGQSPVFFSLEETQGRFAQARAALEIALGERPHQWRNTFFDMRLSYVRECALNEIDRKLLVAEEIERLLRFDQEHGTSYTETLRCYLEHKMNALKASSALFVHRATMVYRLKRIQEIAGINFDDSDQVLYLQLSFRLFFSDARLG